MVNPRPATMAEILEGVHLIDGVNPGPDFTTNLVLLKDRKGDSYTLLDTGLPPMPGQGGSPGYPGAATSVESYCHAHKIPLSAIQRILLTHLHLDHTGNLRYLAEKTGAKIYAHWIEAAFIAQDPPYKGKGMPPREPVQVHVKLKDGDAIDAFDGLVAYHTPGHTPGHVSYHCPTRHILFAGDAIFGAEGNYSVTPPQYTFSAPLAAISLRRLATLEAQSLVLYHGSPLLKGAAPRIHEAARSAPTDDPSP